MAHGKHTHVKDSYELTPERFVQGRNILMGLALISWVGLAAGFSVDPARFHQSYLVAFLLAFSVVIGALFFVIVQHLTGAAWSKALPKLAAAAPREGGLNVRAETKAITDAFSKGLRDSAQILKTGQGEKEQ